MNLFGHPFSVGQSGSFEKEPLLFWEGQRCNIIRGKALLVCGPVLGKVKEVS